MIRTLYIGGSMGPQIMMDWYSDNGFAPRTPSPSTNKTSSNGGSGNQMTKEGAKAFIEAVRAAERAGYSPSNPAPPDVADRFIRQANKDTGYKGAYGLPSQLNTYSDDNSKMDYGRNLIPDPYEPPPLTPKTYYVDEQGNIKSGQVTDMTKWYNDFKAQSGAKPTADDVRGAMDSYRNYVAGKTNPNSGDIWNTYGERIGNTGTGSGGYTDFSKTASNAIVNPSFVKTSDNDYAQRYLTATNGTEPGFIDYNTLNQTAQNWLKNNPGSLWDEQSLIDLWKTKYGDTSLIPSMMQKYKAELGGLIPQTHIPGIAQANTVSPVNYTQSLLPQNTVLNQTSLLPATQKTAGVSFLSMPDEPELPDRPVYTQPSTEAFSWEVPISERPPGTEDWIWSRSMKAKDNWDKEQKNKSDDAYRNYTLQLEAWQNDVDRIQRDYDRRAAEVRNYYDQQGLIPPLPGDLTPIIRQAQSEWQKAYATGDQQAMNYWHNVAEQARLDEGWGSGGVDGNITAGYLSSAGLPTWERQYKETAYNDALKQQEFENQLAQDKYDLSVSSRNSSGSAAGSKPTKNDYISAFMASASQYKTAVNYQADLQRYKAEIIKYVGIDGWNALYQDAEGMKDTVNPNYIPGTPSPIRTMLGL